MKTLTASLALAALLIGGTVLAGESPAPRNAYLYIGWPNDGEVIRRSRFRVWFGLRKMGIAPAGVEKSRTGHHHLLIDTPVPLRLRSNPFEFARSSPEHSRWPSPGRSFSWVAT